VAVAIPTFFLMKFTQFRYRDRGIFIQILAFEPKSVRQATLHTILTPHSHHIFVTRLKHLHQPHGQKQEVSLYMPEMLEP
jgi:hypothetical protein